MNSNRNVIVFGEAGSGKSSLVNLLIGQNKAKVSDKAVGCTFNFERYETPNFNLYDTVGLSEGAHGTIKPEFAIKELISLLRSLKAGVSLLIFVIEKGRIKESLNKNYNLFVNTICMMKVPVILLITHCEMETVRGTWWEENKAHFEKYGMSFNAVVSGSALQPDAAPEIMQTAIEDMNNKTVEELLEAIRSTSLKVAWKVVGGWSSWFYAIVEHISKIFAIPFQFGGDQEGFEGRLVEYFGKQGYGPEQAVEMASHIAKQLTS